AIFLYVDGVQVVNLAHSKSWNWATYHDFIDCIDTQLVQLDEKLGHPHPFRVWDPTFPDITVELSKRHPDWEFTRTNDFWSRADLAIQHGRDVEAVAVPETVNLAERTISAPQSEFPNIQSAWMTWNEHFLNRLWREEGWKPNRWLCQRGRWQAFLFMKSPPAH
ncbi:MAG: hypothetical protein ACXVBW_15435, partial [Bdellovibrionota bacterium]